MYVNNIPDGSIPFIASGADGRTFNDLRGLIPGALGNLGALNPVQLFNGFTAGTYPPCAEITLQTVDNDNVTRSQTQHVALVEMVEMNPCMFPGRSNPASGKVCRNAEGFDGNPLGGSSRDIKEKTTDIYNQQYSLVSKDGESIGIYEMGSLAGSSGVAYQTSMRSPLSYNIDLPKSSPMTELSFSKFGRGTVSAEGGMNINARDVIHQHNANVSSFYNKPVTDVGEGRAEEEQSRVSYYDELIQQLSNLLERDNESNRNGEDLSDIHGDSVAQFYYYGISAVLLYLL